MGEDDAANGQSTCGEDLSHVIRLTVPRGPGDIVRCTRVGARSYRCNWWRSVFVDSYDQPGSKGGQLGTTYRVARSAFLDAVRMADGLRIMEIVDEPRGPAAPAGRVRVITVPPAPIDAR